MGVAVLWAVLLAAIGLVLASLTGRRAYATGITAIYLFLTWTLSTILVNIGQHGPGGPKGGPFGPNAVEPLGARLGGLISPFSVLEGVRQWLGGTNTSPIPPPGSVGFLYGIMFLVLLAVCLAGLAARYRRVGAS